MRTRRWLVIEFATSTKAATIGPNLTSWSTLPPSQPLTASDSISTNRKANSSGNCGALKSLRPPNIHRAKALANAICSTGTPQSTSAGYSCGRTMTSAR